jgi:hypothetical protein
LGLDGGFAASRRVNCVICFDARDCCVTETGLLVRLAASFGGSRCRSEFLSRSASQSERRHSRRTGARSAPAIAGVGRFRANGGFDSALSWKKCGFYGECREYFLRFPVFLVTVEARCGGKHPMIDDWDEREEIVAAGSICPLPDCGALVISYRPPDCTGHINAKSWCEFRCSRCGTDFAVPEDELIFQSVPKEWLLARVHAA